MRFPPQLSWYGPVVYGLGGGHWPWLATGSESAFETLASELVAELAAGGRQMADVRDRLILDVGFQMNSSLVDLQDASPFIWINEKQGMDIAWAALKG